jgi:hypothetical protein
VQDQSGLLDRAEILLVVEQLQKEAKEALPQHTQNLNTARTRSTLSAPPLTVPMSVEAVPLVAIIRTLLRVSLPLLRVSVAYRRHLLSL